jgi:hypothetical protein
MFYYSEHLISVEKSNKPVNVVKILRNFEKTKISILFESTIRCYNTIILALNFVPL